MRGLGRLLGLILFLAVVAVMFFIIRNNLRVDGFIVALRENDVEAARQLLAKQPSLVHVRDHTAIQLGTIRDGKTEWRGHMAIHRLVRNPAGPAAGHAMAEVLFAAAGNFGVRLEGESLLHLAVEEGNAAVVAWLLDKGHNVNERNTCDHDAEAVCSTGQFAGWQPFDRIRTAGVSCSGCEHEGQTPLHAAHRPGPSYPSVILAREADVIPLLLARGADVHAVDARGRTALHLSGGARWLCGHGADPGVRDRDGKTPADIVRDGIGSRYDRSGADDLQGWLAPGGGCAQLAQRARAGAPVSALEVDAAWRAHMCSRDPRFCEKQSRSGEPDARP